MELREIFNEVKIVYNEGKNTWDVDDETHGITLSRNSLENAKLAVKAEMKKLKVGNFKRFMVWYSGYYSGGAYKKVEVTSRVENAGSYSSEQYWVSEKKSGGRPSRSKAYASELFRDTKSNADRFAKILVLEKQIDVLEKKKNIISGQLVSLESKEKK